MDRRQLLQAALVSLIAASVRAADRRAPRILLRSSWPMVNIGDI